MGKRRKKYQKRSLKRGKYLKEKDTEGGREAKRANMIIEGKFKKTGENISINLMKNNINYQLVITFGLDSTVPCILFMNFGSISYQEIDHTLKGKLEQSFERLP